MRGFTLAFALLALCTGCSRGAKSAGDAMARLRDAVEKNDPAAALPLLDEQTRWSIASARKYSDECLRLIAEAYPPERREREAARFINAGGDGDFLVEHEKRYHELAGIKPRLAKLTPGDFVPDKSGHWGYSGLRAVWEEHKNRTYHDLETVRQSAEAYRSNR
jgi:hypothetical protein